MARSVSTRRTVASPLNPAAFSPNFWLIADAATTDGGSVASWTGSRGTLNTLTQGTAGARPTYSANKVQFDGDDSIGAAALTGTNPAAFTLITVARKTSVAGSNGTFVEQGTGTVNEGAVIFSLGTTMFYRVTPSFGGSVTDATDNGTLLQVRAITFGGGTITAVKNGVSLGTAATTDPASMAQIVLGQLFNATVLLTGDICEVIGVPTGLTVANLLALQPYFAAAWPLGT